MKNIFDKLYRVILLRIIVRIRYKSKISVFTHIKRVRNFYIGKNSHLLGRCFIFNRQGKVHIGNGVEICDGVRLFASEIGNTIIIEDGVYINNDCIFYAANRITIKKNAIIGPGVRIFDNNHNFSDTSTAIKFQGLSSSPVTIGEGAWIGTNAIILSGVTIGQNSVVGAGSVVTESIPDYTVAAGSPAKVLKRITPNGS